MSILIEGMDLPKGDDDVRLIITSDGTVHRIIGWAISERTNHKAVELPSEHGRLGDLDLCLETFKLYCQDCKKEIDCYSCWVSDTFDIVKRIPTVLEASE